MCGRNSFQREGATGAAEVVVPSAGAAVSRTCKRCEAGAEGADVSGREEQHGAQLRGRGGRERVLAARRVVRCGRSAGRSVELFWGWFLGHIALPPPCHALKQLTRHKIGLTNAALACSWPITADPCMGPASERGHGPALPPPRECLQLRSAKEKRPSQLHVFRVRFGHSNRSCKLAAVSACGRETRQVHKPDPSRRRDVIPTSAADDQPYNILEPPHIAATLVWSIRNGCVVRIKSFSY